MKKVYKYLSLDFNLEGLSAKEVFLIPTLLAFVIRLFYHFLNIPDFWGDSYHSMYITWATLENNWVYSDYKGREVVWLPFYRYLSTFFIFITQYHNLLIPHVLNMILGSISCGFLAVITMRLTANKIGIMSGILLALAPWHIAYSHMNMPEITALLLLILAFFTWQQNQYLWLIPIGFAGVLTRNELTTLLGVLGLILLVKREWRQALCLFIGSAAGLGIWAWWNLIKRGELTWWIASRSRGSSWDRHFVMMQGNFVNHWYLHLAIFLTIFPVILVILGQFKTFKQAFSKTPILKSGLTLGLISIVVFHWIFLLIMQTEYFTAPNGRYWLYSLPMAFALFGVVFHQISKEKQSTLIAWSHSVSLLVMLIMMFIFYHQRMIYAYNQELGKHIGEAIPKDSNIWFDFPDILYFSEIDYSRAYSSDQIMPMEYRYISDEDKVKFLTHKFDSLNIGYIVASPVSYSIVLSLWPNMEDREPFEWGSWYFTPLFSKFDTEDQIVGQPLASWMRYLGGVNKKSVLWKVERRD